MRNNILGGLVIFVVVLTCLLMIEDFTNPEQKASVSDTENVENIKQATDLAIVEAEE